MTISQAQIFAAADQLVATGDTPTLAKVRKALGGGSFTTISEAMATWRGRQQASTAKEPLPPAVASRLEEMGAEIWAAALDLAQGRLAAERQTLEAEKDEIEAGRAEAAALADQLAAELEQEKARRLLADESAVELRAQVAAWQERAHTAEARAKEIERRADELRRELDRAHGDVHQAREALIEAKERAAALQGQIDASRSRK